MKSVYLTTIWKFVFVFLLGMIAHYILLKLRGQNHLLEVSQFRSLLDFNSPHESTNTDFNEINDWVNNLPALIEEDKRRINNMMRKMTPQNPPNEIRNNFYEVMNFPLQAVCTASKFFGGIWIGAYGCIDGNKFVCLDNFYQDVKKKECLIYTFGVAGDWSFEQEMASMGCRIQAHDPTIDGSGKPVNDLILFKRIGIKELSTNTSNVGPVLTLKDAVNSNGDLGKKITYLKVDVEGSELKAIAQWINSGILENVRQIGIEIHTAKDFVTNDQVAPVLLELLDDTQKLYELGFRLISSTNNGCSDKGADLEHKYNPFFELVFYKP